MRFFPLFQNIYGSPLSLSCLANDTLPSYSSPKESAFPLTNESRPLSSFPSEPLRCKSHVPRSLVSVLALPLLTKKRAEKKLFFLFLRARIGSPFSLPLLISVFSLRLSHLFFPLFRRPRGRNASFLFYEKQPDCSPSPVL